MFQLQANRSLYKHLSTSSDSNANDANGAMNRPRCIWWQADGADEYFGFLKRRLFMQGAEIKSGGSRRREGVFGYCVKITFISPGHNLSAISLTLFFFYPFSNHFLLNFIAPPLGNKGSATAYIYPAEGCFISPETFIRAPIEPPGLLMRLPALSPLSSPLSNPILRMSSRRLWHSARIFLPRVD